jgi:hypothetical protein
MKRLALLATLLLAACGGFRPNTGPAPELLVPAGTYAPVAADEMVPFTTATFASTPHQKVARIRLGEASRWSTSSTILPTAVAHAGQLGANAYVILPAVNGEDELIAFRVERALLTRVAAPTATPTATATTRAPAPSSGRASGSSGGCVGSCPVHVRGYRRTDGTYVKPHTRSRPGTKSSSGGRRRS